MLPQDCTGVRLRRRAIRRIARDKVMVELGCGGEPLQKPTYHVRRGSHLSTPALLSFAD
jgi:hypothetical protein